MLENKRRRNERAVKAYQTTKDIIFVHRILGYKRIETTVAFLQRKQVL